MSYSSRRDDSRHRERSPPRRERDSSSSSRRPPGPPAVVEKNVLQFMKTGGNESPLSDLYNFMQDKTKIKVWTRNFKEVRGILTGYILAYDKHWNLVLKDVDEISLVSKKSKTPFLRDVDPDENLPDMPEKVPRKKKDPSEQPPPPPPVKIKKEGEEPKKKRTRNKKKVVKRHESMMFVRGDNIVMLSPLSPSDDEEEEEEDGEDCQIVEESGK